jgi:hypothetical protein
MATIPGIRFDITGASGSQGLLTPKSGWRCYVLPRGGFVSQDSTGTLLTFDSAAIAGRFAALNWIQAGLSAANIRQVSAVGGNSLSVSGAALTVSENDRIFLIGSTEPTISGGSVTYSTPATTVRQRDDDASDLYVNSMITTNADGLVQFFSTPAVYDCVIQDGNRALQGSLIDVSVGLAEGISTSQASTFGATVTINAALGVTGFFTGDTVTVNRALGVTGWATFGATVTMNANAGVTGTFAVGATSTFSGTMTVTGRVAFGNSVSIDGALGITGALTLGASGVLGGLSVTTGIFGVSNQPRVLLTNNGNQSTTGDGTLLRLVWDTEDFDVGSLHSGSSSAINITDPGLYLFIGQVQWATIVGATGTTAVYSTTIRKNNSGTIGVVRGIAGATNYVLSQSVSLIERSAAGDYYDLTAAQTSGTTQDVTCTPNRTNSQFSGVKLF